MEIQRVKVHIYSNGMEVHTENAGTIYDVYEKCGKYGIDWNTNRLSYSGDGDVFAPFDSLHPLLSLRMWKAERCTTLIRSQMA